MPEQIIVCDANVYRRLNLHDAEQLTTVGRRKGVVALASPIVACELLHHLADENDPHFGRCVVALRAMHIHTCLWNGGEFIPFLGSGRDAVSRRWFGRVDPAVAELSRAGIGWAVIEVSREGGLGNPRLREFCRSVADFVSSNEATYGAVMADQQRAINSAVDDRASQIGARQARGENRCFHETNGERYAAEVIAKAIASRLGHQLEEPVLSDAASNVIRALPVAGHFMSGELRRILVEGANPENPANQNSVWDLEHASLVGPAVEIRDAAPFAQASPLSYRMKDACGTRPWLRVARIS